MGGCAIDGWPMSDEDLVLAGLEAAIGEPRGWTFRCELGDGGYIVYAEHPASFGLIWDTATVDPSLAVVRALGFLEQRELAVVDGAPELTHPDTAMEVRSLTSAFDWSTAEVAAVAMMLLRIGALAEDEVSWLRGFAATDAPLTPYPMSGG